MEVSLLHSHRRLGQLRMDEALREAITFGNYDDCEVLLATGVLPHAPDEDSGSPLHLAASLTEANIVGLLLDYGAPINFQNREGDTPLHLASVQLPRASRGNFEACEVLVKRGADLRIRNDAKKTPLELAERSSKSLLAKIKIWQAEYADSKRQNIGNTIAPRVIQAPVRTSSATDLRSSETNPTKPEAYPGERMTSSAQRIIQKLKEENQAQEEQINSLLSQIRALKAKISEKELQFQHLEADLRTAAGLLQQRSATLEKREKHLESQSKKMQEIQGATSTLSISVPLVALSDFFLIKLIATGSSGSEIYKAAWKGSIVAYKKASPRYKTITNTGVAKKSNEEWHGVHLAEVNLLCRLRHKNIVPLLAASTDPRHMALIYEYHKSRDLRTVLSSKVDITPTQRASWALSAARALAFLHAHSPKPILHMDIDSSNFIVDGAFLKLSDFSNCAIASELEWDDHSRLPRGNPAYMAPEQFRHQDAITPKAEVYGFGVLLWEIWTRQVPWKGVGTASIEAQILVGDRMQIPDGEIPATISRLIKRCWVDEPVERPDMIDVVSELWNYKRLGAGKSPASPYPSSGQSSQTVNTILSPRRNPNNVALPEAPLVKPPVQIPGTPPPSGPAASVAVPLPLLPAGTSPLSSLPRSNSPTPQRFAPSLQKYKLHLLEQIRQEQPDAFFAASASALSPPVGEDISPKGVARSVSPAPSNAVDGASKSRLSGGPPVSSSTATTVSSSPPPPSASAARDSVDDVMRMLDDLVPMASFEPPLVSSIPNPNLDISRRESTIDEILKRAESLLGDI